MDIWNSVKKTAGRFFSAAGLGGLLGGAGGAIVGGVGGFFLGGPAGVIPGLVGGAKTGALIGSGTVGALGALNVPPVWGIGKWLHEHVPPVRWLNNFGKKTIEWVKGIGIRSDIELLIEKIKTILYQLLKIVVEALGRNNEKVTEKVRQEAETKKAAQSRRKEEPAKGEQNKELAQKKEMSRGKDASISRNDMPSKTKTAPVREPVRAGIEKSADKAAIAAKTASKTNAAAMLAQAPVKRMPVKDLAQTLNNKSAAVKPVIGKSAPGKDLAKIR